MVQTVINLSKEARQVDVKTAAGTLDRVQVQARSRVDLRENLRVDPNFLALNAQYFKVIEKE